MAFSLRLFTEFGVPGILYFDPGDGAGSLVKLKERWGCAGDTEYVTVNMFIPTVDKNDEQLS